MERRETRRGGKYRIRVYDSSIFSFRRGKNGKMSLEISVSERETDLTPRTKLRVTERLE